VVVRHEGSKKRIAVLSEWERRQLNEEELHHFIFSPNILVIEPSRKSLASILCTGLSG
jgi:ATP-dependent protease HslVU (ClpYQ) ATPase subunit